MLSTGVAHILINLISVSNQNKELHYYFFPADFETGKVDILTFHRGEPPLNEKDEKYIIQIWKRERMVFSP